MTIIAVAGAKGRMGQAVLEQAAAMGVQTIAGTRDNTDNWADAADVIIDFTSPVYSMELLKTGKPVVCGTTGFDGVQFDIWSQHAEKVPLFWASNFSMGVHVLNRLAAQAAKLLPDYDAEIVEMHHNRKEDAPSGTALTLGKAVADARGQAFSETAMLSREGAKSRRKQGEIGFATLRGGGVIGEHRLVLAGEYERIEVGHISQSRGIYADGALRAAQWLVSQSPGLYGMDALLEG